MSYSDRVLSNLRAGKKMGFDYTVIEHVNERYATVKWSLTPYKYHDPSGDPNDATYHLLQGTNVLRITYIKNGKRHEVERELSPSYSHDGRTVHRGYTDHNSWLDTNKHNAEWFDTNGNWTGIRRWLKVLGSDFMSGEFHVDYDETGHASFYLYGRFNCYSASSSQDVMKFDTRVHLKAVLKAYKITYNANGGTNSGDNTQTKYEDKPAELFYGTNFSKNHFRISGWNTSANGNGTAYKLGGTYTRNASDTLYAQWKRKTYTITYNANGGKCSGDNKQTKQDGIDATLFKGVNFSRTGYTLYGWNTKAKPGGNTAGRAFKLGATYSGNNDITLYAQWKPRKYNVTLKDRFTNKKISSFKATYDSKLTSAQLKILNSYTQAGYEVLGWSKVKVPIFSSKPTEAELSKYKFRQNAVFKETSDIVLYPILKYMSTIYVRVKGEWKLAVPYVRVKGQWKPAIAYVRVKGQWRL